MLVGFFFFILILIVLFIIFGLIRTWQMQHGSDQKIFMKGKVPHPMLQGSYKGSARGYVGPWMGKTFDRKNNVGTNNFLVGKITVEKFVFNTSLASGLQDTHMNVLKVDYDNKNNSYFVRKILDEIVEIDTGVYLGKIHIRLFSFFTLTVGYFTLRK